MFGVKLSSIYCFILGIIFFVGIFDISILLSEDSEKTIPATSSIFYKNVKAFIHFPHVGAV